MSDIIETAPKLAKLLPLLSSDQDGEVIAAARAISRALASVGADWHDLVKVLTEPASAEIEDFPFVLRCLHGHPALTDWEARFIASIVGQQARGRRLSAKQRAVVMRAWERLQ